MITYNKKLKEQFYSVGIKQDTIPKGILKKQTTSPKRNLPPQFKSPPGKKVDFNFYANSSLQNLLELANNADSTEERHLHTAQASKKLLSPTKYSPKLRRSTRTKKSTSKYSPSPLVKKSTNKRKRTKYPEFEEEFWKDFPQPKKDTAAPTPVPAALDSIKGE